MPRKTRYAKSSQRSRTARRSNFFHGWVPDLPDHRDFFYTAPAKLLRALPSRVDLRMNCPPVYHQGELHSCTANAIAAAIQFDKMKQAHPETLRPSRLFIYYNERAIERSIDSNCGAQIRTVLNRSRNGAFVTSTYGHTGRGNFARSRGENVTSKQPNIPPYFTIVSGAGCRS
jgi:C1A family cysteine protease